MKNHPGILTAATESGVSFATPDREEMWPSQIGLVAGLILIWAAFVLLVILWPREKEK
jgi:hypothetical protein